MSCHDIWVVQRNRPQRRGAAHGTWRSCADVPAGSAGIGGERDGVCAAAQGEPAGPQEQNLSPRLIGTLLHEPVWFGGVLAVFAGFLLQASAVTTAATQMKRLLRQDKQLVSRPIRLALGYWPTRTRR